MNSQYAGLCDLPPFGPLFATHRCIQPEQRMLDRQWIKQ
jgi:hypothetical protein